MNQKEIIDSLSKIEQEILKSVLNLEQSRLHIINMAENASEEKKMVSDICSIIRREIKDEA